MPAITVLIPARNAEATLGETLESLVVQTLRDFDVLLVDDASTDGTRAVAESFAPRLALRVLALPVNAGVAGALNHGLAQIGSPYVARIDADDVALPTRLAQQHDYLQDHPDIDACSSAVELFYPAGGPAGQILAKPATDAAIKTALVQYCALSHPACLLRRRFFDEVGLFDTEMDFAEDYDLWCRGALLGKRYANLPEVLTRYRQHAGQVGQQKRQLQYERDLQVKRRYIAGLLGENSAGYLPEFFHLLSVFASRDVTAEVVSQSMPLILRLGRRVGDTALYDALVAQCMARHLRG
ncbi:MAG: glycosyltransferase [Rhodoferax sp.]|jgi:glycosyltransferase involved in cell wall biosynthesis|nr:glycosyltransferase [Rhodoferax sp.]